MIIFAGEMHQVVLHIEQSLQGFVPTDDLRATAMVIAEEVTGLSRTDLLCGKGSENFPHLQTVLERVKQGEPLQYIFGHTFWRGLDLHLSPATLIPRPETSELVDWLVEELSTDKCPVSSVQCPVSITDCGTGSGCIAIAIKKELPKAQVTGLDISEEALAIARENAHKNGVEIAFQQLDLLEDPLPACDVIVSNPPYVRELEKAEMERNVLDYEPHRALFVSDTDPLLFYRRIAEQHAAPLLFFEINQYLAHETTALLEQLGYKVTLRNDIYGNPRMIRAQQL